MLLHFAAGNGAEIQAPVSLHKTVGQRVQSELTTVFYISRGPVCCWNHFYGCWWTHGNFPAKQPCPVPKSIVVGVIAGLCLPEGCERGTLWSVTGCAVSTVGRMVLQKAKHTSQASKSVGRAAYSIPPWLTATSVFASREQHQVHTRVVFLSKRRKKAGNVCVPNLLALVKRFSILSVLISCFCRAESSFPRSPLCLFPAWLNGSLPKTFRVSAQLFSSLSPILCPSLLGPHVLPVLLSPVQPREGWWLWRVKEKPCSTFSTELKGFHSTQRGS